MNYKNTTIKLINKMFWTFAFVVFLFVVFSTGSTMAESDDILVELDTDTEMASNSPAIILAEKKISIQDSFEFKNKSKQKVFSFNEEPGVNFEITKKRTGFEKIGAFFKNIFSDEFKDIETEVLVKKNGLVQKNIEVELKSSGGKFAFDIKDTKNLKPGKYEIELKLKDDSLTSGEEVVFAQDFAWGVLAMNANKAVYNKNEIAFLQFAVLDERGNTICDADLDIEINYPGFGKNNFSTETGEIIRNENCGRNNVIDDPDYYLYYKLEKKGDYDINVKARTANGDYNIQDKISVKRKVDFEIERIGPTRIFPKADYDMELIIKANKDYQGEIIDEVPSGFHIYKASLNKEVLDDNNYEYRLENNRKLLVWKNLDLHAGDEIKLRYYFDAPNVAPDFYLLGGLRIGDYIEERAWQIASDAVGSGIAWMSATSTSNGTDLNPVTAYALDWGNQDFDTTKYSYDSANPTRLQVKEAGDYLVALSLPLYRIDAANNRTRIQAEFRVDNVKKDVGVARSSYIRNYGGHDESSDNMTALLEDLTADQYIEIYVKGVTSNRSPVYIRDQASMFVEKIEASEVAFSGTAVQTTDSTDLSGASAFELEWAEGRKDSGLSHSDTTASEDIILDTAGDYLVFVNIPIYTTTASANLTGNILLDSVAVSGGTFQQGYMRDTDDDNYSSIHWAGVVQSTSANQTLSVSTIENSSSGTLIVNGEKASIYVQKLDSENVYYGRGTNLDVGTDWNDPTPRNILWENDDIIDTGVYNHSTSVNQHQITVSKAGDYLVAYNDAMDSGAGRPSNMIELRVNGTAASGAQTNSHYIQQSTQESSASLTYLLTDLSVSDIITVTTKESGDTDIVNDMDDAVLFIRYIDDKIPPVGNFASAVQKTNGSGLVDISFEAIDGNDDNQTAKIEYVAGASCDFSTPLDPTLSTIDASTTATFGDPDISNTSEYQIGNPTNEILTDSGMNTVYFDWESDTDIPDADGTYCLGLTLQDATGATSSFTTTTVDLDNYPPSVSAAIIENLNFAIGDTLTATITVASDIDTYSIGNTTINGVSATNLQKINNTTYTIDYTIASGNYDRTSGNIPYFIALADTKGNVNSSFTGNFSNGSIDANAPNISSIIIPDLMFGIGDTITATITLSSDIDTYSLGASTINGVSATNLQKINNTTYALDYVVVEGNTDRASSTIPYSIILSDSYSNENSSYAGDFTNGSLDAHRLVISSVFLTNGNYGIGDSLKIVIDADESNLDDFAVTVNGKSIISYLDNGDSTYDAYYQVAESDTDRTANTIPASIVLTDNYGNTNSPAFTSLSANSATVDAHKPEILTISLADTAYKIGDTVQAIVTVTADTNTYVLGTTTINGVDASNINKINDSTYSFDITISEGDTGRTAGTIPVSVMLKDQIDQYNDPAFATVEINTASIDATYPSMASISFLPNSGILTIGEIATATISLAGAETNATINSATINGSDVSGTFVELGGGDYRLVYTVIEGNNDHPENDDLPVNIVMVDAVGNQAGSYTATDPLNRPGVDANKPNISNVSFNIISGLLKVGDTATATISSDDTGYSAGLITINGVDVSGSLVDNADNSYSITYTVLEGHTDITDASDLSVSISLVDIPGNIANAYTTADAANRPGVDGYTPVINSVSFLPSSGVLKVGDTATATISVSGAEAGLLAGTAMTINGADVSGSFSDIGGGDYEVIYTVNEGDTDILDSSDLPIDFNIQDSAGNISPSFTTADASNRPGVDANTPTITAVSFLPSSGVLKVGDTATATISVSGAEAGLLAGTAMTINGVDVSGSFVDIGGGDYEVVYTVVEGHVDIGDASDLPVDFNIQDNAGNISGSFTTADASNRPGVDANMPTINSVSFVPSSGLLKIGDIATATLSALDYEIELLLGTTATINGVDVSGSFFEIGGGDYSFVYIVSEGNTDIDDASDLSVDFVLADASGNNSLNFTTSDADNRPGVDANKPNISTVVFEPTSGLLAVGDIATATISVSNSEIGLLAGATLTINNIDVSGSFSEIGGGDYIVTYTVQEGEIDVLDSSDLPIDFTVQDTASNESITYSAIDSGNRPGVDANTPSVPGDLSFVGHDFNSITIQFGATTTETDFKEYKIFYKIGSSGVTENDSEFNFSDDIDLLDIDFDGTSTTTINGLLGGTSYVFNIYAYDNAGNVSSASAELSVSTNYAPSDPSQVNQLKNDGITSIFNQSWTDENNVKLTSTSTDPESDLITLYYQFVSVAATFTTTTTVPVSVCGAMDTFANCTDSYWVNTGGEEIGITSIPDSGMGYKWQVIACDNNDTCSEWSIFDASLPNVKVDNTLPEAPGNLTEFFHDSTSVVLTFGASTTEDYFKEYKIFYKVGASGVTVLDTPYSSSTDFNLGFQDYGGATSTKIDSLSAGTQYVFNVWAYDEAGNKTSANEITLTTDSASNPPTGVFNSVAQKIDGSGAIDISVEIDDTDNDDTLRLRIDYVSGSSCDFSTPLDPTLDIADENITSDFGDPAIDNDYIYQVGTTSAYIWTSPGANTVNFDWLSVSDVSNADGVYCLRLTVNDGTFSQSPSATTTIYIDNLKPSVPGILSLDTKNTYDLILNYGIATTENNFAGYKVFYKEGISGVAETDIEHIDANLDDQYFNGYSTTTIDNLNPGIQYVVNIWAYDDYGNKSSSSEQSYTTNYIPTSPVGLKQKKDDDVTLVTNSTWTDENNIRLEADVNDGDTSEVISVYFELREISHSFLTATTVPVSVCSVSTDYGSCSSKVWSVTSPSGDYSSTPFNVQVHHGIIPDFSPGYKWQVMACDDSSVCSDWVDAGADPNFKIDTINPSVPGNLSVNSQTASSLTLDFGAASVDNNFYEYKIFYKLGNSGVLETDSLHGSSTDSDLSYIDYNSTSNTTINGLSAGSEYVFNIWAYDVLGRKASATIELVASTNYTPTASFLSANERTDGTGVVDISIEADDGNDDDLVAKLEYVSGVACDFSSPLDPTLDETDANATSTYLDAKIINTETYQIGSSIGFIYTVSGTNNVHFDWLSATDISSADGTYCLRLTANDLVDDQSTPVTTTLTIDNTAPSVPGDLTLNDSTGNSITLDFGATTTETNFVEYRIFYKAGIATVNENDFEHTDGDLSDILFNGTTETTVNGLLFNTQYSFKIFTYDAYGNKSSSGQTTFTTNAPPTGAFNSIAQKTNGSGIVDISIEIYDMNLDDVTVKLEYVSGASCDFTIPLDPTLDESALNIASDHGTTTISNSASDQIGGGTDVITTSDGSNTINFDWSADIDIGGLEGVYCLRLTANDGLNDQIALATSSFFYDDISPTAPADLSVGTVTGINVNLNLGLAGSDSSFKEYKIFYKEGISGVTESDSEFNKNDDLNLGVEDYNSAPYTIVTSLAQNTDYVFNIWIYDEYGNKANALGEVSTTTLIIPSATWREDEDTEDPTASFHLGRGEHIRLRLAIANTRDWNVVGYAFDLEYGLINGTCEAVSTWVTIPDTPTTEHFQMIDSDYFTNLSSTTAKLINAESYIFEPGYIIESPSAITGTQDISAGAYTELEFTIEPTSNAPAGQKYCFRTTNNGELLDNYAVYPEFSLAPAPMALFVSAAQKTDGTEAVDIAMDVIDVNGDNTKVKIEYVLGSSCDFTAPLDPTLDETSENILADFGTPAIDNNYEFQIGTTTGWITTSYGTNTVAFDWDVLTDLTNADDTYCLRITATDNLDDQINPATTTLVLDHIDPTVPGSLEIVDITSNSVELFLGTSSIDTNFKEYKIFYKEGASGVTESDSLWSSSSDANLGVFDWNGATTTEVTGLEVNKQYVFQIYAYDEFGHKSVASTEVTASIRYVSVSENWHWYADQHNETPTTTLAAENVAPIDTTDGAVLKLRLALREIENITGDDLKIRLQYSNFADFSSGVNFVGEFASSTATWRYADGVDTDNDTISTTLLSGISNGATHNESGISTTSYAHLGGTAAEWEFTIRNNGALAGNTYYFRAYDDTNKAAISKNGGNSYPSITVASPGLAYSVGGYSLGTSIEGVMTTVDSSFNEIGFGSLTIDNDEIAAHKFTVNTNAGGGYQLFVYQRQSMIAGNGADINSIVFTNDSPGAWPINPDPSAFGYHAGDDTLSGASPSRFSADNTYAAFDSSHQEIAYSQIPVENEEVTLIYRIEASNMQAAGDYETEIVYILLPTFYE